MAEVGLSGADHQIQRAVVDAALELGHGHGLQLELDLRMGLTKAVDKIHNKRLKGVHLNAEPERPDDAVPGEAGVFNGVLQLIQRSGNAFCKAASGCGELDCLGVAYQKLNAQFLLERGDVAAERRLGDEQVLRCLGKIQRTGKSQKTFDLENVQSIHPRKRYEQK